MIGFRTGALSLTILTAKFAAKIETGYQFSRFCPEIFSNIVKFSIVKNLCDSVWVVFSRTIVNPAFIYAGKRLVITSYTDWY